MVISVKCMSAREWSVRSHVSPRCLTYYANGHRRQLNTHNHLITYLPIITTMNIRHDYRLQQNRLRFTDYKKADWTHFTEDTEFAFAQTTMPTNIHTANRIFTKINLMADKYTIPKGRMHNKCKILPDLIACTII